MLKFFSLFLLFFLCPIANAQNRAYILKDLANGRKYVRKDSAQAAKFLDSLAENNFYFTKISKVSSSDSHIEIEFDKGKDYNQATVQVTDSLSQILKVKKQFYTKNLDSVRRAISEKFVEKGYSFARIRTKFGGMKDGIPQVQIFAVPGKRRVINSIVYKGYDKLPRRFVKNIDKNFVGREYSPSQIEAIRKIVEGNRFISQEKPPQTLFTRDSTNVYIPLGKRKASTFDGIIGFGNDKTKKITFNGSINVNFANIFNKFEEISIFWQRNPDRGQTFNLQTDVPYIGGTNIGLNLKANIYRQDSAYATAKIQPALYYHISQTQKIGLKLNFETSSVTQPTLDTKDFTKKGIGIWYALYEPSENPLLMFRTKIAADFSTSTADYPIQNQNEKEVSYFATLERNFNIKGNHWLNAGIETAMQGGKELAANEMLKFGGWNSMRGFAENSLLANSYYYVNLEYRYLLGNQAFFDIFGQYGELKNYSLSVSTKIYSVGLGFHFFLPIGLMTFQISNGSQTGNPFHFNDTKIHWGVLSKF